MSRHEGGGAVTTPAARPRTVLPGQGPWTAVIGGGLAGAAAALSPALSGVLFVLGGFTLLAVTHLPAAVAVLLVLRSTLDHLTETGLGVGPVLLNPASALGLLVLGVTVLYLIDRRLRGVRPDWGGWPAVCFGILAVYAVVGTPVGVAALGRSMLAVGIKEAVRLSSLLALYILIVNLQRGGMKDSTLLRCLYMSMAIPAALAIWQFMFYSGEGYYSLAVGAVPRGRLTGTFYHANSFGVYLAFLLMLGLILLQYSWHGIPRWALTGVMILGGVLLVFTFSRGAWVFLVAGLAVKLLLRPGRILVPIALVGLILAASFSPRIASRFSDLRTDVSLERVVGQEEMHNSFEWRMYNWYLLIRVGAGRPVLGHGTGSTPHVNPLQSVNRLHQTSRGFDAHNEFVRSFVEGGLVGVAVLICFFLFFFRWAWRVFRALKAAGDRRADLAGVALGVLTGLLLLSLLAGNPLTKTSVFYYFIILFAILRRAECDILPDEPCRMPGSGGRAPAGFAGPSVSGGADGRSIPAGDDPSA